MFLDNYKRNYQFRSRNNNGKYNWLAVLVSVLIFALLWYFFA
ncbi:hypothetical protein ACVWYG_003900 [Pedobacter sp. UYEF25]